MAKKTKEQRIRDYVLDVTLDWTKEAFTKTKGETSEKAKNLAKSIENLKGISTTDKKELSKSFGYIIGEEIPFESDEKLELPSMVALVLTGAFDNHSYPLNAVLVHTSDGMCISPDGTAGNLIEPPTKHVRPATKEEVEAIPETQIKGLMKEARIVLA